MAAGPDTTRRLAGGLPEAEPDGQFGTFTEWVNKATSWIGGENALCADARGRVCRNGGDFMRARDEGAFPVRFWFGAGPETPAEQRRSVRAARKATLLRYPWRRGMI